MSERQPQWPYTYQPGRGNVQAKDAVFAVSGPGTEAFREMRMTRDQAIALAAVLRRDYFRRKDEEST